MKIQGPFSAYLASQPIGFCWQAVVTWASLVSTRLLNVLWFCFECPNLLRIEIANPESLHLGFRSDRSSCRTWLQVCQNHDSHGSKVWHAEICQNSAHCLAKPNAPHVLFIVTGKRGGWAGNYWTTNDLSIAIRTGPTGCNLESDSGLCWLVHKPIF